jgi:hypothetical protein
MTADPRAAPGAGAVKGTDGSFPQFRCHAAVHQTPSPTGMRLWDGSEPAAGACPSFWVRA